MSLSKQKTKGVELLEGESKKAIRKLALPLILSMLITSIYSIMMRFGFLLWEQKL